eukprot:12882116-Alexandrium_andersonii.AAC.1
MADAAEKGITWEVLSYRVEKDHPEACECIQSVCNQVGDLQMLGHEMQAISQLGTFCRRSATAAGE